MTKEGLSWEYKADTKLMPLTLLIGYQGEMSLPYQLMDKLRHLFMIKTIRNSEEKGTSSNL